MSNWLETNRTLGPHLTDQARRARDTHIADEVRRILDVDPIDEDLITYVMNKFKCTHDVAEKAIRQVLIIGRFEDHIRATTPAALRRDDAGA